MSQHCWPMFGKTIVLDPLAIGEVPVRRILFLFSKWMKMKIMMKMLRGVGGVQHWETAEMKMSSLMCSYYSN